MKNLTWASNVCLQPERPTVSWAASQEKWPAGWGRWWSPSALPSLGLIWSTPSRPVAPYEEKMCSFTRGFRGGHKDDPRTEAPPLWRYTEGIVPVQQKCWVTAWNWLSTWGEGRANWGELRCMQCTWVIRRGGSWLPPSQALFKGW